MNTAAISQHDRGHYAPPYGTNNYQTQQQWVAQPANNSFISIDYYQEEKQMMMNNQQKTGRNKPPVVPGNDYHRQYHRRNDSYDSAASSVSSRSVTNSFYPNNQPSQTYYSTHVPSSSIPSNYYHTQQPQGYYQSSYQQPVLYNSHHTYNNIDRPPYHSLETDSSIDICPVKEDHIWMVDNLVTIEEAEQLIDIYQNVSMKRLRSSPTLQPQQYEHPGFYKSTHRSKQVPPLSLSSLQGPPSPSSTRSHYSSVSKTAQEIPARSQQIEYTNEEFANFIFEQLKDVLPPDQSKLFGEKVGSTYELSGINETFSIFELMPGEKIEKSKGEDKCRIIEVEMEEDTEDITRARSGSGASGGYYSFEDIRPQSQSPTIITEQYHEKSFLTCVICLKGIVEYNTGMPPQPPNSPAVMSVHNQRLFGINFYDMSRERPEHFVVLDHVGKSCLFSNNTQLYEVIENYGSENIYLLVVNVMYKSKISNPHNRHLSSFAGSLHRDRSFSSLLKQQLEESVHNANDGKTEDSNNFTPPKKTGVGKLAIFAVGTGVVVLTYVLRDTVTKINKPFVSKLLSILARQINY